jgi:futalosine hydrolase
MKILIVAATDMEVAPLVSELGTTSKGPRIAAYVRAGHAIDLLTTGVGMVATAAWCSRTLTGQQYDLALNVGLCGAFDRALPLGRTVHVVSDRIAELGAEDHDAFLTIQDLTLVGADEFPFCGGRVVARNPPSCPALRGLPPVAGITVNTVHGCETSIAAVVGRFAPQVESMEGAAFMYACAIHGVPFAQIRAVSNVVEPRNRAGWRISDATRSLTDAAIAILDQV